MHKPSPSHEILVHTLWSFTGDRFVDQSAFSEEVRQYQIDITGKDQWRPDLIVVPVPSVQVAYEYWNDDGDQIEDVLRLVSTNGRDFTSLELLFQIHNAVVENVCDDDHHFFEGLTLEDAPSGQPPQYLLNLGS